MAVVFSLFLSPHPLPSPTSSYTTRLKGHHNAVLNTKLEVASSHSNAKILKSNRRTKHGRQLSMYDTDDDEEEDDDDEEEEDDDEEDEWFSDDDKRSGNKKSKADKGQLRLQNIGNIRQETGWKERSLSTGSSRKSFGVENGKSTLKRSRTTSNESSRNSVSMKKKFRRLSEEIDLDERWFPLLEYLSTFGLKDTHFIQMYERHMPSLQINAESAQERLEFLLSHGVKHGDIRKIILRQPQILQYTVEKNLQSHVNFLTNLGIPNTRIGQIITATPSLFSYSVENSLKPTVRYLLEEVGIKNEDLCKVVQLSPQVLVQRIETSWSARLSFLTKELGAPRDSIVKMVSKHPQILHYSVEDGLLPRINFLRGIGMKNSEILKVLTSHTQVFSLSLEGNLKPKYKYLINELRNEVHSLTKYPTYLSLSLDQRIRPRHRFLVALKKAPRGPFPLASFVPTDERFCQKWGTSLDKYLDFRQRLQLKELAKKYEKQ
ncbi:hypothetical protein LIER_33821 [Lithospermum erythrorhizon]|uniref:Transcription termination factor MTERF9, chloroplastic n=1 Tax=Lithospermum erythrorhizon TaxID=34254 RepID=A0AAV3RZI9_LITER